LPSPSIKKALPRRAAKEGECAECYQDEDDFKIYNHKMIVKKSLPTVWIGCSEKVGSKHICSQRVHGICLGFVEVSQSEAEIMPNWYCRIHRQFNRGSSSASNNVSVEEVMDTSEEELMRPPSARPKKAKNLFAEYNEEEEDDSIHMSTRSKGKKAVSKEKSTVSKIWSGIKNKK
jgi:hypothetical protein